MSHLLAAGARVNDVAQRVGHVSAKMTLDVYGHAMPAADADALARLATYYDECR